MLDKSPDQALAASVWMGRCARVDSVSQQTLAGLSQSWNRKKDDVSEPPRPLERYLQNILLHVKISKMTSGGHPQSLGTDEPGSLSTGSSPLPLD